MKKLILLPLLLISLQAASQGKKKAGDSNSIKMEADQWAFTPEKVEFSEYKSRPAMKLLPAAGFVILKDFSFSDGTIEFDMETIDPNFSSFYFRWQNEQENECFYLRTGRAGNDLAKDAVQYAPFVSGVNLWDIMEQYQTNAHLIKGDWNHIRLVISGQQMRVYVNDEQPTLIVTHLEGNTSQGTIAFDGQSYISNLVVKRGEVGGLSPVPAPDVTDNDPNYLRRWDVSVPLDAPAPLEFRQDFLPKPEDSWEPIEAERLGFINLTRKFGKSETRRIVWLKTTITSQMAQKKKLAFGFSDEVWVLINGRMLYVDKNLYGHPIMKYPGGRCTLDNTSFEIPLNEGENELLIGVANSFFGWAVVARLDDTSGLVMEE